MSKVTLEFKEEWLDILAKEFGYREKVTEPKLVADASGVKSVQQTEVDNPQSKADFVAGIEIQRLGNIVKQVLENQAMEQHRLKIAEQVEAGIKKA